MDQKVPSTHIFPRVLRLPSKSIVSESPKRRKSMPVEEHLNLISLAVVLGGTVSVNSISNCSSFHVYEVAAPTPPYMHVLILTGQLGTCRLEGLVGEFARKLDQADTG